MIAINIKISTCISGVKYCVDKIHRFTCDWRLQLFKHKYNNINGLLEFNFKKFSNVIEKNMQIKNFIILK